MLNVLRLFVFVTGACVALASLSAAALDAKRLSGVAALLLLAGMGGALGASAIWTRRLRFTLTAPLLLSVLLPCLAFEWMQGAWPVWRTDQTHDPRSKEQVIAQLRGLGRDAFPGAFPSLFFQEPLRIGERRLLPLGGVAGVDTVLCREAQGWAVYSSDRFGFNNPDSGWGAGPSVVVLGDSFVHGACLGPDEIFPGQLRKAGIPTINLGMSDNGPLLMLATLLEYGRTIDAAFVVWTYYDGNDLYRRDGMPPWRGDLEREWAVPILRDYLESGRIQGLANLTADIDPALRARLEALIAAERKSGGEDGMSDRLATLRRTLSLQATLGLIRHRLTKGPRWQEEQEAARLRRDAQGIANDLELFETILERAAKEIRRMGARPLFLYLPSAEAFTRREGGHPLRGQVLDAARRSGFEIVDIEAAFHRQERPLDNYAFGARGGHFSPLGHRQVVGELLKSFGPALSGRPPQP